MDERLLAATAILLALTGCGEVRITYGDSHCGGDSPGVVVEFVARSDGSPVAVSATGVLTDGPYVEQMSPVEARYAGPGRSYSLAGGYGRQGIYEVRVQISTGEVLTWSRIKVAADRCGPFTVVLQGALASPPPGN